MQQFTALYKHCSAKYLITKEVRACKELLSKPPDAWSRLSALIHKEHNLLLAETSIFLDDIIPDLLHNLSQDAQNIPDSTKVLNLQIKARNSPMVTADFTSVIRASADKMFITLLTKISYPITYATPLPTIRHIITV